MIYNVLFSKQANDDLMSIYEYISLELCAPNIAEKQIMHIISSVDLLESAPRMHRVYEDLLFNNKELRIYPVDNYVVFYEIDDKNKIVNIVRIMYKRRNIKEQFNK